MAPFAVIRRTRKHITIDRHGKSDTIAINRVKPAYLLFPDPPPTYTVSVSPRSLTIITQEMLQQLQQAVSGQHRPACRTFLAENIAPGESKGYRCPAEECAGGQVYGTAVYDKDSDICLSALHSGVVTSLAANITIKHLSTPQPVLGTAQNRIVSHSKKGLVLRLKVLIKKTGTLSISLFYH
ncbi:uncharacterized protein LOC126990114, partial [Eriocheir sinensis]|uniref:uncharacterized protein LOC126990114 n=1 Tax=Eriocheir sinensis TaxID=95602 RepID=UPI0021C859D0